MLKSVVKNFSILTTAQIVDAVIAFLFIAFVARQFGPELFGKYILIGAYVRLVSLIVNAGVAPIAFRELARNRDDPAELFDDVISLRLTLGIIGYLALMTVLFLFTQDRELLTLMAIAAFPLVFEAFATSYTAYYTAHEQMGVPGIYQVAQTAFTTVVGVMLLLAGYGLLALITSGVVTNLIGAVIWSVLFRSRRLRFTIQVRFSAWRRLIMLIIPFAPIHVSNQLNRVLNIILLGRLPGPLPMEQSVGYYSPAQSITNAVVMIVMGLRRALIPPVTVRLSQGHTVTRELGVAMKLVVAVFCLPLLVGTWFMAPEIISVVFGDQYAPSATALMLLGWAGALQIAAMVPESFLFSQPEHKLQDYIPGALIAVLTNAILCVLLIGEHGIVGAAVAAISARVVYFVFVTHYCQREMRGQPLRINYFSDVVLLLVSAFALWYLIFAWIGNVWIAFTVAGVLTLTLIAVFMLYLRSRLSARVPG